jgi:predicted metal-dependent HD superfamily phosphohydrolase
VITPDLAQLRARWRELCMSRGIADEQAYWEILDAGYGAATRHYHNWAHIADCLTQLDVLSNFAKDAIAIELALWFHDVVYDSRRSDNEEQSALIAEAKLSDQAASNKIAAMIRATTHREPPPDSDTALLCDIDLVILAADAERYDAYARVIRKEYDWVSEAEYRTGRGKVLRLFLERPYLYTTKECGRRWEAAARRNLEREITMLQRES